MDRSKSRKTQKLGGNAGFLDPVSRESNLYETAPATAAAREWDGWGTDVKPAIEPVCLARKPLSEKTIAANVLRWGTAGINADGCRIETTDDMGRAVSWCGAREHEGWDRPFKRNKNEMLKRSEARLTRAANMGRWPANLIPISSAAWS